MCESDMREHLFPEKDIVSEVRKPARALILNYIPGIIVEALLRKLLDFPLLHLPLFLLLTWTKENRG
jgi:hypothetical protein